jgi:hypothetical protein
MTKSNKKNITNYESAKNYKRSNFITIKQHKLLNNRNNRNSYTKKQLFIDINHSSFEQFCFRFKEKILNINSFQFGFYQFRFTSVYQK